MKEHCRLNDSLGVSWAESGPHYPLVLIVFILSLFFLLKIRVSCFGKGSQCISISVLDSNRRVILVSLHSNHSNRTPGRVWSPPGHTCCGHRLQETKTGTRNIKVRNN